MRAFPRYRNRITNGDPWVSGSPEMTAISAPGRSGLHWIPSEVTTV